jgi:hypothetical protein
MVQSEEFFILVAMQNSVGPGDLDSQAVHCLEQIPPRALHLPGFFASSQFHGLLEHTPDLHDVSVFHFPSSNDRGAIHL